MNNNDAADVAPILSATILLLRDGPSGLEVFMVLRHRQVDFASGALVFPGGKLARGDWDVRARCRGVEALDDQTLALSVGAIREAFEESGVLLARPIGSEQMLSAAETSRLGDVYRKALDRGEIGIGEMLEREQLELACDALTPFAHWVTPAMLPKRFDTYFFLAHAPSDQVAGHDDREVVDSEWVRPAEVIERVTAGQVTMVPATQINLEKLGRSNTAADAIAAALASPPVRVEPQLAGRSGKTVTLSIPAEADYGLTEFSFTMG